MRLRCFADYAASIFQHCDAMTLVLSVIGPETLWMVADRRLTRGRRVVREDARKLMFLETEDGFAILGYAGLGATARGSEPADWMSAVLRGRNWPMEPSLRALAGAAQRELPPHLSGLQTLDGPQHSILIPAVVAGEMRLYSITLALSPDRRAVTFRHTRWRKQTSRGFHITPRIAVAGSGAEALKRDRSWRRPLLRLVAAHARGRLSDRRVADELADLSLRVSAATADRSVGPRCIVAWRHRKRGLLKGGGGHRYYTGSHHDTDAPALPTISRGMDSRAVGHVIWTSYMPQVSAMLNGDMSVQVDVADVNAALAQLPETPDERLL